MNLKQNLLALALAGTTATSALAETEALSVAAANAFTAEDVASLFEPMENTKPLQLAALSAQEMRETEGAVAPLVYVGLMTGGRFIAQRAVTQRVAQNMVSRGATNILAPNRSIAKNIAGRNPIREYHPGPGSRYTHYHTNSRNGSHVWYGSPR